MILPMCASCQFPLASQSNIIKSASDARLLCTETEFPHSSASCSALTFLSSVSRRTVHNWQVRHKSGKLIYSDGKVLIKTAGYYYVYSQMYYNDDSAFQMEHQLNINRRTFMQSRSAVDGPPATKGSGYHPGYKTNYNGGVVFLNTSDYISVRTPFSRFYSMKPEYSYFGAFLIHPA